MKKVKKTKTKIKIVYDGGVTVQFDTTHGKDELQRIMNAGFTVGYCIIDSVNVAQDIADDVAVIHTDKILFYMIVELNDSSIIVPERRLSLDKSVQ